MHIALIYPPTAYPMMPYLAPFLLKGWLEAETKHKATVHDLNIEFHHYLWRGSFGEEAAGRLSLVGDSQQAMLAELLSVQGETSWEAMRDIDYYQNPSDLWPHANLLKSASRLAAKVDIVNGVLGALPLQLGAWSELLDQHEHSVAGKFIEKKVIDGMYQGIPVIGLSVAYVQQLLPALLLARLLKRRNPSIRVVLGGSGATHFLDELITDISAWDHIDYFIPFEGELELVRLLDALENDQPLPTLNVAYRVGDRIHYEKELGDRPNVSATPCFDELAPLYPSPEPIYPILTSKGCYWGKCAFCTHHEGYGQGFHRFPKEDLNGLLRKLISDGARAFYFVDEALPPATLQSVAQTFLEIREETGLSNLRWMAEARIERNLSIYPEPELLARAGCRVLVNGIESGSQQVIDHMRKGIDLQAAQKHLRDCAENNVNTGWMFFLGFPGETSEQSEETFQFIDGNQSHLSFASIGVFQLERGSPIWNKPELWDVSEILGRDQPYATSFSYRLNDGALVDPTMLKKQLAVLHTKYRHLKPLFSAAVDRASCLFLESTEAAQEQPLSWDSQLAGGKAKLYRKEKEISISSLRDA